MIEEIVKIEVPKEDSESKKPSEEEMYQAAKRLLGLVEEGRRKYSTPCQELGAIYQ